MHESWFFYDEHIFQIWQIWDVMFRNYCSLKCTGHLSLPIVARMHIIPYTTYTYKSKEWKFILDLSDLVELLITKNSYGK